MAAQAAGGRPLKGNEYATAGAFRRALQDRLAATAKSEGVDLQRIRRQVAFDRLLARLFSSTNPPWVLKGGYALELKFATARTTKDIDLGLDQLPGIGDNWNQRAGQLLAILQERAALVMDDFFEFIIGEPASELDAAPYGGGRSPLKPCSTGEHSRSFTLISVPGICSASCRNSCAHEIGSLSPEFPRRSSHPFAARNTLRKNSMFARCQESGRTRVLRTLWTWCCLSIVVA
jgi:hypothetical protein